MSELRNALRETPEYQEAAADQQQQAQAATAAAASTGGRQRNADTVGAALDPILDLEKGDAEFWTQVLQLVVLVLILRELRGGSL